MNNKFLSDYLPPAMVRDLRRSLRTRSYCITLGLALLAALWVQFSAMLHPTEQSVFSTGVKLAFIAAILFWFIIPNRAGAAVSADAKVRGTNFLTLTPLSSRSIILQMWLSAAAQIILVAAVGSLFLIWRQALPAEAPKSTISLLTGTTGIECAPPTPAHEWMVYGIIVLCGLIMCAVSLFLAQLNRIFRMAGLIFILMVLWGWVQENIQLLLLHPSPLNYLLKEIQPGEWVALVAMSLLSIATLLELARRCYAAPAENCARALRLLVLLPLLSVVVVYAMNLPNGENITEFLLRFSASFTLLVCMSDALLPAPTHRNRAEPMLPGIPPYLQQNGSGSAALVLTLMLLATSAVQCGVDPTCCTEADVTKILAGTAALVYYLLVALLLADMMCKRSNPNRPVYGGMLLVAVMILSNMLLAGLSCHQGDAAALLLPGCGFFAPHSGWDSVLLASIPMLAVLGAILYRDRP